MFFRFRRIFVIALSILVTVLTFIHFSYNFHRKSPKYIVDSDMTRNCRNVSCRMLRILVEREANDCNNNCIMGILLGKFIPSTSTVSLINSRSFKRGEKEIFTDYSILLVVAVLCTFVISTCAAFAALCCLCFFLFMEFCERNVKVDVVQNL